jgi:hypothetical protein
MHDDIQSESADNDQLVSPSLIRHTPTLPALVPKLKLTELVADELADRQDIPFIVRGFGATLTITDGSVEVEDHLATALSGLSKKATNDRSSLTLLVEFKGNVSSAGRITQGIIDHMKEHLECLAVYMPKDVLNYASFTPRVELSQVLLAPTGTSILRHLMWKGNDISDLFSQWRSASNIPFDSLRTLNLACGLSLEDCIQILSQCENLVDFSAQSIGHFPSLMKHDYYDKEIPQLVSLTIKSSAPVGRMFSTLRLTKLENISLDLGQGTIPLNGVVSLKIPWATLQSVRVVGLRKSDSDELMKHCTSADYHLHQTLDGTTLNTVG